jgi:protein SCO1/2
MAMPLALAIGLAGAASSFAGKDVTTQRLGEVLHLRDHLGQARTLASYRGKAVLIFFGYTHCPDVCPTTLIRLNEAMNLLGPLASKVQVLWVTVDPDRDTQDLLSHYVPAFNSSFVGLRGTEKETAEAADAFKVDYVITHYKDQILVDHSAYGYLLDVNGHARVKIPNDLTPEQIAHDVRAILAGA